MRPGLIILVSYLLGSIPFGYLIVRLTKRDDVRETGSGGTGATNVSRRAGKAAGVLTLALDALKGAAAVLFANWIAGTPLLGTQIVPVSHASTATYWWIAAAGVASIVGHMFPLWLGFRGGKGVATGLGVFIVLAPIALGFAGIVFLSVVWRTRYVSLGSIIAAATIPLFIWVQHLIVRPVGPLIPLMTAAAVGGILIIFAHRANIRRLVEGTESRFR